MFLNDDNIPLTLVLVRNDEISSEPHVHLFILARNNSLVFFFVVNQGDGIAFCRDGWSVMIDA